MQGPILILPYLHIPLVTIESHVPELLQGFNSSFTPSFLIFPSFWQFLFQKIFYFSNDPVMEILIFQNWLCCFCREESEQSRKLIKFCIVSTQYSNKKTTYSFLVLQILLKRQQLLKTTPTTSFLLLFDVACSTCPKTLMSIVFWKFIIYVLPSRLHNITTGHWGNKI